MCKIARDLPKLSLRWLLACAMLLQIACRPDPPTPPPHADASADEVPTDPSRDSPDAVSDPGRRAREDRKNESAERARAEPSLRDRSRVEPPLPPRSRADDEQTYRERGIASWYGPGFDGRRTASGERYDMNRISAAHKTLPFGTLVRVHNLDNGRTLDVAINDRGPFIEGRIIDLSKGAARKLDLVRAGVAPVEIEVLAWPEGSQAQSRGGIVQVASFRDKQRAGSLARRLTDEPLIREVVVEKAKRWHRVRIVGIDREELPDVLRVLREAGFEPYVVRP